MIEDNPKKLCLLIFSPMIVLLVFAGLSIFQKWQSYTEMTNLHEFSGAVVTVVSSLIHETQKERGMSVGYLGSKASLFAAELAAQRILLDNKLRDINAYLVNHPHDLVSDCVGGFDGISAIRKKIDKLEIESKAAIVYYSNINKSCIDSIYHIALSISNKEVSQDLYAFINILQGKDQVGIERAILSMLFSEGQHNRDNAIWFANLLATQAIYFDAFIKFVHDPVIVDKYHALQAKPVFGEISRIEQIISAQETSLDHAQVKAADWFQLMTVKMDLLKQVEDLHSNHLINEAKQLKIHAEQSLVFYLVLTVLAFWITLLSMKKSRRLCLIAKNCNQKQLTAEK